MANCHEEHNRRRSLHSSQVAHLVKRTGVFNRSIEFLLSHSMRCQSPARFHPDNIKIVEPIHSPVLREVVRVKRVVRDLITMTRLGLNIRVPTCPTELQ